MAKQTVTTTTVTDDIDGSANAQEVAFSFDGVDYTVDLGKKNRSSFEKALKPYVEAATKVTRRRGGRKTPSASRSDYSAIREWAHSQGIEVSDRGRVSKTVVEQYDAAH